MSSELPARPALPRGGVAREFAMQGIRALSISPGPVKTPFPGLDLASLA
jgi:hypothetical protein